MITLLKEYVQARRGDSVGAALSIVCLACCAGLSWMLVPGTPAMLITMADVGIAGGIIIQLAMSIYHFGRRQKAMQGLPGIAVRLMCVAALLAATLPEMGAAEPPAAELPGWTYDYAASIEVSLPPIPAVDPGNPQKMGIIGVGICGGVAAVGLGYIIYKVVSSYLKLHEFIVTNNAACGECPAKTPDVPNTEVPVPVATGEAGDTCPVATSPWPTPDPGQPLPLLVEHSQDKTNWVTIAYGTSIGSEFMLPSTGFWRVTALSASVYVFDGMPMVHAPPGVLEHSPDLKAWTEVSRSFTDQDMPAEAGFYRVRLN